MELTYSTEPCFGEKQVHFLAGEEHSQGVANVRNHPLVTSQTLQPLKHILSMSKWSAKKSTKSAKKRYKSETCYLPQNTGRTRFPTTSVHLLSKSHVKNKSAARIIYGKMSLQNKKQNSNQLFKKKKKN